MTATAETTSTLNFTDREPLVRALNNALLFAGKDATRPALCTVKFEFDGTELRTVATNSYVLIVETVEYTTPKKGEPPAAPFEFLVDRDAAAGMLKTLKAAHRLDPITLYVDTDGDRVTVRTLSTETTYRTADSPFPKYRELIPRETDTVEIDEIAYTAEYLALLGKVLTDGKRPIVNIKLFGKGKPSLVKFIDGPTVLIMPSRLPV
jgi:DNA polymerase III sliding clamp (beta) subunit (PCNA family)